MKTGGRKNYGFGRSIQYASRNVLRDRFGDGRYGTRHSHEARLKPFLAWAKSQSIRDLRDVSVETLQAYAIELKDAVIDGCLARATAVNRLSSVNVLMEAVRGDDDCWISPKEHIGSRNRLRRQPPQGLNPLSVWAAAGLAEEQGHDDLAIALVLCRFTGARIREAALLSIRKAARSAADFGNVTITRGSKGNRAASIPREIAVSRPVATWLDERQTILSRQNLIPVGQTFSNWYRDVYRRFGPIAERYGLHTGFHALRAAFACDRYKALTEYDAPCVAGKRIADRAADSGARAILAEELGHGRIDVVGAYIGGRR